MLGRLAKSRAQFQGIRPAKIPGYTEKAIVGSETKGVMHIAENQIHDSHKSIVPVDKGGDKSTQRCICLVIFPGTMNSISKTFIDFMLSCSALKFGDFTTKSGRKTPYFINTGAYKTGSQLAELGKFYADALFAAHGKDVDNLFGPAYKGIPLAVVTAEALFARHQVDVTVTFNRKEAKEHGEGGSLVGYDYAAATVNTVANSNVPLAQSVAPIRVVLVEDVTTAGTSVRESLPLIESSGKAKAVGLLVSVDRMEKGLGAFSALQEIATNFGLKTTAITSFSDLFEYLKTTETGARYLQGDPTLLDRMQAYRDRYGVG
jgi:orotate phosphoribosyltransferase